MSLSKELLAPKEITRQELKDMVAEWVADGHTITQCPPGVALNFRSQMAESNITPRKKRSTGKTPKRRVGKPVKTKRKS